MSADYSKKIIIRYSVDNVDKPIIYELIKRFDLRCNILKARILPRRDGVIVLDMGGTKDNFDSGIAFLLENGLRVEALSKSVTQNLSRCVQCGACTAFCPTGALSLDPATAVVSFDAEKCNGCEMCVSGCPVRAMEVNLF
ncbi:MAG: 4Fe-4S binding protein [Deltaproteobacteria bacterium]|nr:4Fe-4S binding protein [Deltaproteobacteria bacterium]